MTIKEKIEECLKEIGVPYKYFQFTSKEAVAPPFIVYKISSTLNFIADNKVYQSCRNATIEFYFDLKNDVLQTKIECALSEHGICWEQSDEVYIESEKMYVVYYDFRL